LDVSIAPTVFFILDITPKDEDLPVSNPDKRVPCDVVYYGLGNSLIGCG